MKTSLIETGIGDIRQRIKDEFGKFGITLAEENIKTKDDFSSHSSWFWVEMLPWLDSSGDPIKVPNSMFEDEVHLLGIETHTHPWLIELAEKTYRNLSPRNQKFMAMYRNLGHYPGAGILIGKIQTWLGPDIDFAEAHHELTELELLSPVYANNVGAIHATRFGSFVAERADPAEFERFDKEYTQRLGRAHGAQQ